LQQHPPRAGAVAMIARGSSAALIALAVGGAVLAGCGGSSTTTTALKGVGAKTCGDVEYGGDGRPRALIVSDLPMRGDSADRSRQQVEAIRLELERSNWKAGPTTVGFQDCDDSISRTGLWDAAVCRANARAYADDPRAVGVIGTYNSGCAAEEIPILNRAGVVMVSPGNTAVCLTERSPLCDSGQPRSLYPTGQRTYARVVPNDAFQGAALAEFAQEEGVTRPFVLYAASDPTSFGQAANFRAAAEDIGMRLAGYASWNAKARSYTSLFERVKSSGADAVVLAGLIEENGAELIRDKALALGPSGGFPVFAFDGFAQQATIDGVGGAARGMFASLPGRAPQKLREGGATLVGDLQDEIGDEPVEQFAPAAGEAAGVMLGALAAAGPHRAGMVKAVFVTKGGGIIGRYRLEPSGDPSVGPVTILRAESSFVPVREIRPDPATVTAARKNASPAVR
ncbi:MAG TPA: branched-chain amino acid ABC transporter substrate-binding protein, partial [Thermoanaerobaculia bacterium]